MTEAWLFPRGKQSRKNSEDGGRISSSLLEMERRVVWKKVHDFFNLTSDIKLWRLTWARSSCPVYFRSMCHLEDVGEVSQIEDVVELDCSGEEGGGDALVQGKG